MALPATDNSWDLVIESPKGWIALHLRDLWKYRDLVGLFVRRDFVASYKQTILGPLWYIIQPLLTTIIYAVVLGGLAQLSTEGQPKLLFYLIGIIFWNYFASNLLKNSDTFLTNSALFGKVYFPRLTAPIATTVSGLLALGFQILLLVAFYIYYFLKGVPLKINLVILLFPYLLLLICLLSMSIGIMIAALTIKYRDLKHLITFGIQLAMWVTPVLYPLSEISNPKLSLLIRLNPLSAIIESLRYALLGTGQFSWIYLLYSTGFTIITVGLGAIIFNKTEKNFIDNI